MDGGMGEWVDTPLLLSGQISTRRDRTSGTGPLPVIPACSSPKLTVNTHKTVRVSNCLDKERAFVRLPHASVYRLSPALMATGSCVLPRVS